MNRHLTLLEKIVLFLVWPLVVLVVGAMFVVALVLMIVSWPLLLFFPIRFIKRYSFR